MKRRDFIKFSGAGVAAGLGLLYGRANAGENPPGIKKYGRLGRTGLKMSDLSFGCGKLRSAALLARAVDLGVNYFDTAPDYGQSESVLGELIKQSGKRDKMIITSKFCKPGGYPGHLDADASEQDYVEAVEGSLKRLNTDYLDIVCVHAMGEKGVKYEERLLAQNMLNAYEKLKKAGKVRYLGVSSHGPARMEELLMKALTSGHFDIIMLAHNFMKFPKAPEVIQEAGKRDVGVVAMKTLAGAKDMGLEPEGESFPHAAFKWVLKNPSVAGLVVTINNTSELLHYVEASGKPFAGNSQSVLERYRIAYSREYCRTGCGECLGSCPENVDIAGVLRQWIYFADYRDEKRAMESYARMEPKSDRCFDCSAAPCQAACPYGLPVAELLRNAHEGLSFTS